MDFVVGHPRSGTMFVSELLNATGRTVAAHELLPKLSLSAIHEASEYYAGRLDERAIQNLLEIYSLRPDRETRIDCCWKLCFVLPPLVAHFPDARFVHLARDPRDNVRSCANLDYYGSLVHDPAYQTDPWRNHWLGWMPEIRRADWSRLSLLEKNAAFWNETHRLAFEALSSARVLRVRIEDLSRGKGIHELFEFLELPEPSAERLATVYARRINDKDDEKREVAKLRGFEVPPFADWTADAQASLRSICGPIARRLGYDLA